MSTFQRRELLFFCRGTGKLISISHQWYEKSLRGCGIAATAIDLSSWTLLGFWTWHQRHFLISCRLFPTEIRSFFYSVLAWLAFYHGCGGSSKESKLNNCKTNIYSTRRRALHSETSFLHLSSPVRKSKHKSWWRSRNRAQLHLHYRRFVSHAPSTGSHCVLLMGISTTRHKKKSSFCVSSSEEFSPIYISISFL